MQREQSFIAKLGFESIESQITLLAISTFLIWASIPFVFVTAYFGTKNGFYDSDNYEGDGCAHDVQR